MQLGRAEARGEKLTARWLRRMAVLFAIGWTSHVLFWPGDILKMYAVSGAVLLLFRKVSPRGVLIAAVLVGILGLNHQNPSLIVARVVGREAATMLERKEWAESNAEMVGRWQRASREGTYIENVRARAGFTSLRYWYGSLGLAGPLNHVGLYTLSLFLLGLYAGRRHILEDAKNHAPLLRTVASVGLYTFSTVLSSGCGAGSLIGSHRAGLATHRPSRPSPETSSSGRRRDGAWLRLRGMRTR